MSKTLSQKNKNKKEVILSIFIFKDSSPRYVYFYKYVCIYVHISVCSPHHHGTEPRHYEPSQWLLPWVLGSIWLENFHQMAIPALWNHEVTVLKSLAPRWQGHRDETDPTNQDSARTFKKPTPFTLPEPQQLAGHLSRRKGMQLEPLTPSVLPLSPSLLLYLWVSDREASNAQVQLCHGKWWD